MSTRAKSLSVVSLFLLNASGLAAQESTQKAASFNDAEIAAIVVAANAIDAEIGDLAAQRASKPEVKQFGKTMSTDHRAVNAQAAALVRKLQVTPAENALSQKLRADAAAFKAKLEQKQGADFDREYIAHEVAYHKAVIEVVDQLLVPHASNAELKDTLLKVRPALVAHLRHAEHLLATLK